MLILTRPEAPVRFSIVLHAESFQQRSSLSGGGAQRSMARNDYFCLVNGRLLTRGAADLLYLFVVELQ
jgi:hypothetical protein